MNKYFYSTHRSKRCSHGKFQRNVLVVFKVKVLIESDQSQLCFIQSKVCGNAHSRPKAPSHECTVILMIVV